MFEQLHFKTYFSLQPFDLKLAEHKHWFKRFHIMTRTQLNYKRVVRYWDKDVFVEPGAFRYQRFARTQMLCTARANLQEYRKYGHRGLILRHGWKRIGVIFFALEPNSNVIRMTFPLLERDLISNGFFAKFLQNVFLTQLYPDRSVFDVIVPKDLIAQFVPLLDALGSGLVPIRATTRDARSREECAALQEYNMNLR